MVACGGVVSTDVEYITSPNYPSSYNTSTECIWEIQAPSGYHIIATFAETFQIISSNVNCTGNYIKVVYTYKIRYSFNKIFVRLQILDHNIVQPHFTVLFIPLTPTAKELSQTTV